MRSLLMTATATALATLLVACGGGDDSPSPAPAPAAPAQTAAQREAAVVSLLELMAMVSLLDATSSMYDTSRFGLTTCREGSRAGTADGIAFGPGTVPSWNFQAPAQMRITFTDCRIQSMFFDVTYNGELQLDYTWLVGGDKTARGTGIGLRVRNQRLTDEYQFDGRTVSTAQSDYTAANRPYTLTDTYRPENLVITNRTRGTSTIVLAGQYVVVRGYNAAAALQSLVRRYETLTLLSGGRTIRIDGRIDSSSAASSAVTISVDNVEVARLAISDAGQLVVTGSGVVPQL